MNYHSHSEIQKDINIMKKPQGLRVQSLLRRTFLIQLLVISLATIAGVAAASFIAERILVNRALQAEADYFWQEYAKDSDIAVPASLNLKGYRWSGRDDSVPETLTSLSAGQHRVTLHGDDRIVHISEFQNDKLALLFQDETVSRLSFYFGTLPLTLVLLFMYGMAFFAYQSSRRAISPIASLADTIENFDFDSRDANELDLNSLSGKQNSETRILANALTHFVQRSKASLERERDFARYASHELRNPLAVIKGSATNLSIKCQDESSQRSINRIMRASNHMTDLISSLLLLAREQQKETTDTATNLNQMVDELAMDFKEVMPKEHVQMVVTHRAQTIINTSEPALRIVAGNLLRNAWSYTERGTVECIVESDSLYINDTGPGVSETDKERIFEPFYRVTDSAGGSGQGLGLALVKKICDNHGWVIDINSELTRGTSIRIGFTNSVTGASDGVQ